MALIPIPIRFENILTSPALDPAPLLIGVEQDLQFFNRLRRRAETQQSGVIALPLGASGDGKTTAVYAAAGLLPDLFEPVFVVPATVQVREVVGWLSENLPAKRKRTTIIRMDGREASDDRVGLKQLMSGLNQLLRGRPDLIVCWPTVYAEWRDELVELARTIGGKGLCVRMGSRALRDRHPQDSPQSAGILKSCACLTVQICTCHGCSPTVTAIERAARAS